METTLSQYYAQIAQAIAALEQMLATLLVNAPAGELADYDTTNWSDAVWQVQNAINQLRIAGAADKFERVTREQMQTIFRAYDAGEPTGKVVISVPHVRSDRDTLRLLEYRYGVAYDTILQYNGLSASAFYALAPGATILIPVEADVTTAKDIAVFGDQSGQNILGRDLPNALAAGPDGDLQVMEPVETFQQAMRNLALSIRGDMPFYETFGLDLQAGADYPPEAILSLVQVKVLNGFMQDPRVKNIDVLSVTRDGNSLSVGVQVQPLQGGSVFVPVTL
jgi:hypothetical protein